MKAATGVFENTSAPERCWAEDLLGVRDVLYVEGSDMVPISSTPMKAAGRLNAHIHVNKDVCWARYVLQMRELCSLYENKSVVTNKATANETVSIPANVYLRKYT